MAQRNAIYVKGYREFRRGINAADRAHYHEVYEGLKRAGEVVKDDSYRRFRTYSEKSASGFRVRSRIGGVYVEQKLRKTTGHHPEYGALQMRKALLPSLESQRADVQKELEKAFDKLVDLATKRY